MNVVYVVSERHMEKSIGWEKKNYNSYYFFGQWNMYGQ